MFEKVKKLFNHRHRWYPVVGFVDANDYEHNPCVITVNYECWCGDGYARTVRIEQTDGYVRVPFSVFSTEGIER